MAYDILFFDLSELMVIQLVEYTAKNRSCLLRCLAQFFPEATILVSPIFPLPASECIIIAYPPLKHPRARFQLFQLKQNSPTLPTFVYDCPSYPELAQTLNLGIHDGMLLPFHPDIFHTRIKQLLTPPTHSAPIELKHFHIIPATQTIVTTQGETRLTPKQYALLMYLLTHREHNVRRSELLSAVWARNPYILDNTIDCHIKALRKQFHKLCIPAVIKTIYGVGYRFEE